MTLESDPPFEDWKSIIDESIRRKKDPALARKCFEAIYRVRHKEGVFWAEIGVELRRRMSDGVPFQLRRGFLSLTTIEDCIISSSPDQRLVDTPEKCLLDIMSVSEIETHLIEKRAYVDRVRVQEKQGNYRDLPSYVIERRLQTDISYIQSALSETYINLHLGGKL